MDQLRRVAADQPRRGFVVACEPLSDGAPHDIERALERSPDLRDGSPLIPSFGLEGELGESLLLRLGVTDGMGERAIHGS
jgi:hypothetical protein